MRSRSLLLVLGFSLLPIVFSFAQPANDNFTNAWVLQGLTVTTNGNSSQPAFATKEAGEPNHAGQPGGRSVWFNWTAPTNGTTRIATLGSAFNTLLAVYTGDAVNALTLVAANDNIGGGGAAGNSSRVEFFANSGTTYRIAIDGRNNFGPPQPASGAYVLNLQYLGLVQITAPANNSIREHGSPLAIDVEANMANPISRIDFYWYGNLIGSDTTAPYSISFSNAIASTNVFFAVAVDTTSLSLTSAPVNVILLREGLNITSPLDGQGFLNTAPIPISAIAYTFAGPGKPAPLPVTDVEFFVDGVSIGQDALEPFSATWNAVTSGPHRITATAQNGTETLTAEPVWITVAQRLVSSNSMWKYFDKGQDLGTVWREPGFDDTGWSNGLAELGYGDDADGRPEATVVGFGPDPNNKYPTTYFRHSFEALSANYSFLIVYVLRDDGAVVYLNGSEAARFNMPAGTITYNTFASSAPQDDGTVFFPALVATNLLQAGNNVLAVEMHQNNGNSSDLSFDLELVGLPVIPRNGPPLVAVTAPTNNASYVQSQTSDLLIQITATATDVEGSVTNIEFFADGVRLGRVVPAELASEFSILWTNPPVGWHGIFAIAMDNEGAAAASRLVNIAVYDSAGSPLIQITGPADGTVLEGPTNILITAQASAPGTITNVEFYAARPDTSPTLLGSSTSSSASLRADYQFRNTLDSEIAGAPALANLGANSFASATVDGRATPVLRFAQNDGLSLAPSSSVFSNHYTLAALFSFETLTSWRRIFDFSEGTLDIGVYFFNGAPFFYFFTALGPDTAIPNAFVQLVLTRDSSSSNVVGYFDGTPQFAFTDDGNAGVVTNAGDAFRLFRDDAQEASAGAIARFRIYDRPLAPAEVAALDRLPTPAGITTAYTYFWANPPFATNIITAVAYSDSGTVSTSAPIAVVVNEPPINTDPPVIIAIDPAPGSTVTQLTSIRITFSERVGGVDGWDLLINGQPAFFNQAPGSSNFTFSFAEPLMGTVTVAWDTNHAIHDFGYPANLPFNEALPGHSWSYELVDRRPPVIVSINPAPNSLVTNVTQVQVGFSESVANVNAADLLLNGAPALNLIGSENFYTFEFARPTPGPSNLVSVTWAANHDITDLALPPNPFNATAPGHTWSYTIDPRTVLVQSNGVWRFVKGTREASNPTTAWRQPAFDDSSWSNALAPFFYGDPYNSVQNPGTLLSDMQGGYTSIYLRTPFFLANPLGVTNLLVRSQSDDGYIMWINGVEVIRYNMPGGEIPFNGVTTASIQEPQNSGAAYLDFVINNPPVVAGTNIVAVHAFNQNLTQSSDFGFNAQLYTYLPDPSVVPPSIQSTTPGVGEIFHLTNITVTFTEPVAGVRAFDLLINGVPATNLTSSTNTTYTFAFPQPAFGLVTVTWSPDHEIVDSDNPPKPFNHTAPGSTFQYTLLNPSAPTVAAQSPLAGSTLTNLTQLNVTFSEPVAGVDATDLFINGIASSSVSSSSPSLYTFLFPQPAYGLVNIAWSPTANIQDLEAPPNTFDPARSLNRWSYTLVDQVPPRVIAVDPPGGSTVINLTQVTITFSEPVAGLNASDLLINGIPASNVQDLGSGVYIFSFPQPNATTINITWANTHGIRDLATIPNPFDPTGPGATWSYTTPDNVAPTVAVLEPAAYVTVRSLTQIRVTFTEPVSGVSSNDLLINSRPARSVSGSGAGPYTFVFLPPPNGTVEVRWASSHGISDLALTPNPFLGGEWTYILDPDASFAGKIVFNEIMFNAASGQTSHEWLELHNVSSTLINLAGWRLSRGVQFTFPNVSIPAGGYLVVAADPVAFQNNYPGIANHVGGWTGRLANSDETIELRTALDEEVDQVHYATEGDWAQREAGRGASPVESMTRSGNSATVTIFAHGYTANDQVLISGADQPEYNGRFTVTAVTPTTFSITINGTPATPATGNIICRQIVDNGLSGWTWFSAADGFGYSLELVNPALPNASGQNWLASANINGTPGAANSTRADNVAPLISETVHFPAVPTPFDSVAITARVQDEQANPQSVTLFYRNHTTTSPGAFNTTNMFDDGLHGDGVPDDGLFGGVLPPFPTGTIIEFYVQATDTTDLTRTWPAPARDVDRNLGQFANALYQVSSSTTNDIMPVIRAVMTSTEDAIFPPGDRQTDAEMNVTIITTDAGGTEVRYLCGVRIRGAGSRTRTYPNNRMNIPNDNRWKGLAAINLNGQFVYAQLAGGAVAQKSGIPASDAHLVRYSINGVNAAPPTAPANGGGQGAGYSTFLLVEPVNGDLAEDLFPEDGDGNVYRASTGNHNADLTYQSTVPANYLARGYMKTSNGTENDWTDLMALTFAFSQVPNDVDYYQAMSTNVNLEVWLKYFAVGTLINFGETSLFNGRGDDYALYRGISDPRFVPIGHDFDTVFGQGDTTGTYTTSTGSSIFIMLNPPNTGGFQAPNMPVLRRFLTNAVFAPLFLGEIKRLCDTVFHPSELNPLFDQLLTGWGPTTLTIDAMKNHAAARRAAVLSQIPLTLTVNHTLSSSNGIAYTTAPTVNLAGTAHAIDTRKVLVNGVVAGWSPWEGRWTHGAPLQPGVNAVLIQSLNSNDVEVARLTLDVWYDDGGNQLVSGAINSDTAWTAAGGPYQVSADINVASGVTLTIQAGTAVYLDPGADIVVANGGRLLAEGTDTARIRLMRTPGSSGPWGGITINGGTSSPETRITYAHIEGNDATAIRSLDGTVFLDHLTFGTLNRRYIDVDRSSFVISHSVFPTTTTGLEMIHGNGGVKAGGRGVVLRNFFGKASGYNDTIDFTGGNRPQPLIHIVNNVFMGSDDDILDLDGTDGWVEGNIFMHVHRNGSPDSASGVSGGNDSGQTSEITVVGNIFFDCDHAANAKQGNFYTLLNNTIVRQTRVGGEDTDAAVVVLADEGTTEGAGFYLEGNIIVDAEKLVRAQTAGVVTFTNNLMQLSWTGPGGNNSTEDPLLKYIPQLNETTNFTSWQEVQILRDWFSLRADSPARGTGPNGLDKGGVIPIGAAIATRFGVPAVAGPNVTALNFPNGSGYTHYKFRVNGGLWSPELPIATPIPLPALGNGTHFIELAGKRDSGLYQDDPAFGLDAVVSTRTWTIDSSRPLVRINEILAANAGAIMYQGGTPDVVELVNLGSSPIDLTGMRLTDDPTDPDKFLFQSGTMLESYILVFSSDLGFGLNQGGDSLYLYDSVENGGALIDSVSFGPQIENFSIGRLDDGTWTLTRPIPGARNVAAQLGDPTRLRINEWLTLGTTPFQDDFVELHNTDALPVALGGLYLSDKVVGWRNRHQIAPLSFLRAHGYFAFIADGDTTLGPEHLNFRLSADQGEIGLFSPDLNGIDCVTYQPQRLNVSQGRSPNGSSSVVFFTTPTPGAPNPSVGGSDPFGDLLVINEMLALNASLVENGRTPDWIELYNGTTNTIDLGDMSLSDDVFEPRRFVFPAGATIGPGQFLRVICDTGATNTGPFVNTNFALSSGGGSVFLFASQANFEMLDAIYYGVQTADLSIGRVPDGGADWTLNLPSPGSANIAVPVLGNILNLTVNEWLADPVSGEDDWFEIYNPDAAPVAIGGLHLSDSLTQRTRHQIAELSFIGTGTNAWQRFVADGNTGAGADHVGFALRGEGEAIGISTRAGVLINGYAFNLQQQGVSEGRFPDGSATIVRFPGTESPGAANWRRLTGIVINEALTHTDLPLEDAIELLNLTDQPIDISGWWLSDDNGTLMKYQLPSGSILPASGFTVIYESQFTNREVAAIPFALSSGGDEVVLSAATNGMLTGFRTAVDFGNAANAVSFGRYVTSDQREEFVATTAHTFGVSDPASVEEFRTGGGATNTYPSVGPIVISEIMYHPPDIGIEDNERDEFIELRNTSSVEVKLFDPAHPTNTWRLRDAVDFDFPPNTSILANSELLVVSFDPVNNAAALAAFRGTYGIDANQPIVGPYQGRLANDSDDIELRRPDTPEGDDVRYILVERVRYFDSAPWPVAADGTGFSIHRVSDAGFGNDPTNFLASAPTPGLQATVLDFDFDGMPDNWEASYGFDPRNPADAILDPDSDGLNNLEEYQAGTLPNDATSVLRLKIAPGGAGVQALGSSIALTFTAQPNKSYSLLWKESVASGAWAKLVDIPEATDVREFSTVDPLPDAHSRIYRVVTPQEGGPLHAGPAIVSSPKSTVVPWGAAANFSVDAYSFNPNDAGITYQWSRNGVSIAGATAASLTIDPARFSDLGTYRVSTTDANGTVTTVPVYLSVAPRILVQPQDQSVRPGGTATFTVEAEGGGPLSYLWMHGRRPMLGETNSSLRITNVSTADATNYSVMVFQQLPWGKVSMVSASAVLSINTSRTLEYVVVISLDGLGGPYLPNYLSNAPAQFPNFARLMNEGAYTFNARCDYDVSETIPNHASMFTGRPVLQPLGAPDTTHHGYNNNFPGATDTFHNSGNANVPYKSSFYDVAHDRGLSTALYVGKVRLGICDRSYNVTNGAPDVIPPDHGQDKIDFSVVPPTADVRGVTAVSNQVNQLLANLASATPTNFTFIHIAEPDLTGHTSGWGSAAWSNMVRALDLEVGRILAAINNNPVLNGLTAVILTTDHGGGGVTATSHSEPHHVFNYTIPFFLWAPGIPAAVDIYSILSNRQDPETNRVAYAEDGQPLRNSDSANLALALLGLPPIPGSYFQPQLVTPLATSAFADEAKRSRLSDAFASHDAGHDHDDSGLRLIAIESLPDNQVRLTISVAPSQGCSVLFSPGLSTEWSTIANYPPQPSARTVQLVAPAPDTSGFYRLRSP